jgi:hypothetical protein
MLGIWVLAKQMEDLNQFGRDWYLDDAVIERTNPCGAKLG